MITAELDQQILHGPGALGSLGDLAREMTTQVVLLVSDAGVSDAGHVARARDSLEKSGLTVIADTKAIENPSFASVEKAAVFARNRGPFGLIVALGGGSSLDTAKGINLLLTNGGEMKNYRGWNEPPRPLLPMIGVPTTAGTGSEAQPYAVLADDETHLKTACGAEGLLFGTVILDPELTLSLPRRQMAICFVDAVSHAVESAVSTRSSQESRQFAERAWELLTSRVQKLVEDPDCLDTRMDILWGAYYAGASIRRSMLGAAHACANPLTAAYDIPHGIAVGLMLPPVVRFNHRRVATEYERLLKRAPGAEPGSLDGYLSGINQLLALPDSLAECGVDEDDLEVLAEQATSQWTGRFNPRPVDRNAFLQLYREAFST